VVMLVNGADGEKRVDVAEFGMKVKRVLNEPSYRPVTISDIIKLTGTSRNTLNQHLRQLGAQGHCLAWWRPRRLVRIALAQSEDLGRPRSDMVKDLIDLRRR
jgi:hypothetical protein